MTRRPDHGVVTILDSTSVPDQRSPRRESQVDDALSLVRAEDLVPELQDLLRVPSVTGTAAESE